jgi:hypothetical protein
MEAQLSLEVAADLSIIHVTDVCFADLQNSRVMGKWRLLPSFQRKP